MKAKQLTATLMTLAVALSALAFAPMMAEAQILSNPSREEMLASGAPIQDIMKSRVVISATPLDVYKRSYPGVGTRLERVIIDRDERERLLEHNMFPSFRMSTHLTTVLDNKTREWTTVGPLRIEYEGGLRPRGYFRLKRFVYGRRQFMKRMRFEDGKGREIRKVGYKPDSVFVDDDVSGGHFTKPGTHELHLISPFHGGVSFLSRFEVRVPNFTGYPYVVRRFGDTVVIAFEITRLVDLSAGIQATIGELPTVDGPVYPGAYGRVYGIVEVPAKSYIPGWHFTILSSASGDIKEYAWMYFPYPAGGGDGGKGIPSVGELVPLD